LLLLFSLLVEWGTVLCQSRNLRKK